MAFYGEYFSFDNVSSKRYGLKITTENSNDTIDVSEYKSDLIKTPRRSKFYATKQRVDEPLILAVSIFSETPLTRNEIDNIERWLFKSDGKFRKLRVDQPDMQGYYYNCRLQKLSVKSYYNKPHEINCVMECNSQYIWSDTKPRVYLINSTPYTAKFVNTSSEIVMSPTYEITCHVSGRGLMGGNRSIKIINNQYSDSRLNTMEFNDLFDDEILTIDTERGIITSNMRTNGLLDLFVYPNFMKIPYGVNNFEITGDISKFKIIHKIARKFGA